MTKPDFFQCPVCGYQRLYEPPRDSDLGASYEICICCGFQFGVSDDDLGFTYDSWRAKWRAGGMIFAFPKEKHPPVVWQPEAQLRSIEDSPD